MSSCFSFRILVPRQRSFRSSLIPHVRWNSSQSSVKSEPSRSLCLSFPNLYLRRNSFPSFLTLGTPQYWSLVFQSGCPGRYSFLLHRLAKSAAQEPSSDSADYFVSRGARIEKGAASPAAGRLFSRAVRK